LKILITGGNGFIGKSLFEAFAPVHSVISVNRQTLDLSDSTKVLDFIKQHRFDVIIHSANYDAAPSFTTKDPTKVLENNLHMFFNLTRCDSYFGRMIYFGSGAEFGRENWTPGMNEDYFDQNVPSDQYGFSKYIMAKYGQLCNNIYNLRLFGLFGKYDDWRYRFIPNICCQAVFDMPLAINQNRVMDFLYIDDLIKIVGWFLENQPKQNNYNVCSGELNEFKSIAGMVVKCADKNLPINFIKEGIGPEYSGDNSSLLREIEGLQFTPLNQSVCSLYNWYNTNKNLIDRNKL
jgi:GDP-L-fucose synthase